MVFRHFPAAEKNPAYRNLLWYLLFGAYHDEDSQRLLLCREILAEVAQKPLLNFAAGKFLREFDDNVLGGHCLVCTTADWENAKCRQLIELKLGDFQEIFEAEKSQKWHKLGRVYLDGRKFSSGKAIVVRRQRQQDAQLVEPQCEHATFIQKYLHALPLQLFTRNNKRNYSSALKYVSETLSGAYQQREVRILKQIESQPQPFYSATEQGNTVRLYASENIPNLERNVRKVFTKDWLHGDLRCSQLAVCGWLWRVDSMTEFLNEKINFWSHLFDYLNIPEKKFGEAKPLLKRATYKLCFGMEEHDIRSYLTKEFNRIGIPERSCEFISEPLLFEMLEAREREIARITEIGATTCYGKDLLVSGDLQPRDMLAQMAQAIEMKIIFPAFELAAAHQKEFKLMVYLFDGFAVHFHRDRAKWMERIKNVVDEAARSRGIPTWLEWDC